MVRSTDDENVAEHPSSSEVAAVIPLFGRGESDGAGRAGRPAPPPSWTSTWGAPAGDEAASADDGHDVGGETERGIAERHLTKRLRTRQLSVKEARTVVAGHDLEPDAVDAVIRRFVHLGYLDDAALADQLVHAAVDRRGQGRKAVALVLARRGIPRDVVDAALAAMPDDDAERALDFARTKARAMGALDHDAALRRLVGQLARRGYAGSLAMSVANRALEEHGIGRSAVRFR